MTLRHSNNPINDWISNSIVNWIVNSPLIIQFGFSSKNLFKTFLSSFMFSTCTSCRGEEFRDFIGIGNSLILNSPFSHYTFKMSLMCYSQSPLSLVALSTVFQGDVTRTGRTLLLCTLRRGADEEQTQEKGPNPDMIKKEPLIPICGLASSERGTQSFMKSLRKGGQHSPRLGSPRAGVGILAPY